jgi:hypothetical protein
MIALVTMSGEHANQELRLLFEVDQAERTGAQAIPPQGWQAIAERDRAGRAWCGAARGRRPAHRSGRLSRRYALPARRPA